MIACDPIRIEALLNHRRSIALEHQRQTHHERLTDTARAGFADEKIGETHITCHVAGKALDMMGVWEFHRSEAPPQFLIVTTEKNQLQLGASRSSTPRYR